MHQKKQLNFDDNFEDVVKLVNAPLQKGDTWYLLDKNWFDMCKTYHASNDSSDHPGPIDNSALFQPLTGSTSTSAATTSPILADSTTSTNLNGDIKFKSPVVDAVSADSRPLRSDLSEAEGHFIVVPEECWNILKDKFGITNPNHAIKRRVIEISPGQTIVEIQPVTLKLCLYGGKAATIERCFSRKTTIQELLSEMKQMFNIELDKDIKLWLNNTPHTFKPNELSPSKSDTSIQATSPIKPPPTPPPMPNNSSSSSCSSNQSTPNVITRQAANSMNKPIALPDSTSTPSTIRSSDLSSSTSDSPISAWLKDGFLTLGDTLEDAGVAESSVVTLEVVNSDGNWPSSRPRYGTVSTRSSKAQPGLCGLSNMGNTCFMNAALQCLSNTPPLTNYILADNFVEDINVNNPLGMHGEIARTYADLIKVMWSGNHTSFLPREFKCAVSRFAPQFNGFAQQDSQELMAFLLDGLHEDLNRIRNKPYIEIKNDIERRPDEVVADESWSNYKKRNDSIVVDTFHAMLKSTLVCPGCKLVSVTFDPFCYLSLPLPVKREKQVNLTFLPAPSSINESTLKSLHDKLDPEELKTLKLYGASISSFNGLVEENAGYYDPQNRPKGCKMQVPRSGPASEICDIVARVINEEKSSSQGEKVKSDNLVVAELSADGRISKVYESNEHYNQISDDIVVVEKKSNYILPLYLRDRKSSSSIAGTVFAKPLFLHVPDLKFDTLYKSAIASLSRCLDADLHDELQATHLDWFKLASPTQDQEQDNSLESDQMDYDDENENGYRTNGASTAAANGDDIEIASNDMDTGSNNDVNTNGNSHKKSSAPQGNAFDLCIVNSFGNHSIETLNQNRKECDYSSKLYLGATFTSTCPSTISPQFSHLREGKFCDAVENFTPKVSPKPTLQLKDCITQFTNIEKLGADDPWYCPKCKKHQQATKKFDIWSLPKVLIIHLKRFSFSRSWRDKIDTLVEFPVENLDMSKYVLNPKQKSQNMHYDLIGVSNHFGGLGGGHYTAYAKNATQNSWYSFDDAIVTQTNSNSVVTRSAYVLFYQLQEDGRSSTTATMAE